MVTLTVEQGSVEWVAARCGIPTASGFDNIVTTSGDPSKSRTKYLYQLAGEKVTGIKEDSFQSQAMTRGIEMESEARQLYEIITEQTIEQVGLCFQDDRKLCACSPDGLIGLDGGIEIKCPTLAVHVEYLIEGKLPLKYFQQVQGSLYVTGRKWWSFVSYFPGIKPFVLNVNRDEKFITALDSEVQRFNADLDEIVKKIR